MKRVIVIKEKCNACMNCVVACQETHTGSMLYNPAQDAEPARIHLHHVLNSPVPLVCHHCDEPACVRACPAGAMQKEAKTGIVTNEGHEQKCVGCWMCVMACPYGAITPKVGTGKTAVKCDLCVHRGYPACVEACPRGALIYGETEE